MNLTLRLAYDIYKELKTIALKEERSINGEINYIIKKYIEAYNQENTSTKENKKEKIAE